jgi:uncharacterized lipoprotein YmbA
MSVSSDWASEDDEQLSQSLSQTLSQELPLAGAGIETQQQDSDDSWASEDDEQLSQSLSQTLSQELPLASAGVKTEQQDSDDSWASEDDEQLSQELLSQQSGGPTLSQLATWVSPRVKLEEAMDAVRGASQTLRSIGTFFSQYPV